MCNSRWFWYSGSWKPLALFIWSLSKLVKLLWARVPHLENLRFHSLWTVKVFPIGSVISFKMFVLLCWRQILKQWEQKTCFGEAKVESGKQEEVHTAILASRITALSVMTYIQLTQRQFGAGVLKWFVYFRYVVKQKCLWLQCCDSATLEGGINYLMYANCISVTMNWRCYQACVRLRGNKGPTIILMKGKIVRLVPEWMCSQYQRFPILLQVWVFFEKIN